MDRKDPITWELFDMMCAFLERFPVTIHGKAVIDLYEIVENAIYHVAETQVTERMDSSATDHGDMSEIMDWIFGHTIPDGCDRNSKLFKNIAIWCVNTGLTDRQISLVDSKVVSNCPGRQKGEIKSWVKWARQERKEINLSEIAEVAEYARRSRSA